MMLYLELFTELGDHCVIDICTIVSNNSLWDTISTDQTVLDELCHDVLGYCHKGTFLNPLCELINCYQNEAIPVRRRRSDLTDHVDAPHYKRPRRRQDVQRNWRYVHLININLALMTCPRMLITVGFHCGPIISCPKNFLCHSVSTGMSSESTFM